MTLFDGCQDRQSEARQCGVKIKDIIRKLDGWYWEVLKFGGIAD